MRNWKLFTEKKINELDLRKNMMKGLRGMHFLIAPQVADELVKFSKISKNDKILEIGGGLGILTSSILERSDNLIVIEREIKLFRHLKHIFSNQAKIVHGDALNIKWPNSNKLVANLPFSIGTKILLNAIRLNFETITVMLQEDLVNRITAKPSDNEYSAISVILNLYGSVAKMRQVANDSFLPVPKVKSAIVHFVRKKSKYSNLPQLELLTRNLFYKRKRKLRRVIRGYLKRSAESWVIENVPYKNKRIFCLTIPEMEIILKYLIENNSWPLSTSSTT